MTATPVLAPGAETSGRRTLGYLPALDGLRGVALVGVLLFHAGHLGGGFLGVDLFFVLSGFLITSLLLVEWSTSGSLDLLHFWSRRLRRLLPASLVALLGVTAYAAVHLHGGALARYRGDALAALGNVANWRAISVDSNYWANQGAPSPLRHMWSLAVEEQLYVLWPIVMLVALRAGQRRRRSQDAALGVALTLYLASIISMALLSGGSSTSRAYYGTDTRAAAVLIGAATAIVLRRWQARHGANRTPEAVRLAVPTAVTVLAMGWVWGDGQARWLYLWGFPVFGLAAALVVVWAATVRSGRAAQVLGIWPLRTLGLMSYGIYLIHWPVYVAIDEDLGWSRWLLTAVRLAVTLGLATVSLLVIERPVRSGRVSTAVWRVLAVGGIVAVVASVVVVTHGAKADPAGGGVVVRPPTGAAGTPLVELIGDSQATALSIGAEAAFGSTARQASATAIGCGIGPGLPIANGVAVEHDFSGQSCLTAVDRFVAAVDQVAPDVVLLHAGAWDIFDRLIDGKVVPFGTTAWDADTLTNFATVLERLSAPGRRVVVLAAPCYPNGGEAGADVFGDLARQEGAVRVQEPRVRRWNVLLRQAAATAGAEVLPYDQLFCGVDQDRAPERGDGVHLTETGAEAAWQWILPRLHLEGG